MCAARKRLHEKHGGIYSGESVGFDPMSVRPMKHAHVRRWYVIGQTNTTHIRMKQKAPLHTQPAQYARVYGDTAKSGRKDQSTGSARMEGCGRAVNGTRIVGSGKTCEKVLGKSECVKNGSSGECVDDACVIESRVWENSCYSSVAHPSLGGVLRTLYARMLSAFYILACISAVRAYRKPHGGVSPICTY